MIKAAALAIALVASSAGAAPVTVTVTNVASGDGSVVVWVFGSADDWLRESAWRTRKVVPASAREAEAIAVTLDLPPGDYGVLAFHDRNDDGKLPRNFLGRFSEPAGASNAARSWIGAPGWSDAKVTIGAEPVALAIALE